MRYFANVLEIGDIITIAVASLNCLLIPLKSQHVHGSIAQLGYYSGASDNTPLIDEATERSGYGAFFSTLF